MHAPEFWAGRTRAARFAAAALVPLGWIYGATVGINAARASGYRSSAKVICIGNLTVGGTGKTPVVAAIAARLAGGGLKVCILSRGYGGHVLGPVLVDAKQHSAGDVGDEPLMLAATSSVIVSRDRMAGARLAESVRADIILMDDGHQNFSLTKDLSLIVVDAAEGFGNGYVLPAGPLRERVSQGLVRANGVILMGNGNLPLPAFDGPILRARLVPQSEKSLTGMRVVAFAGIGRPQKFFEMLKEAGAVVVGARAFSDHHAYSERDLIALRGKAQAVGATLITTEKDYVRLAPAQRTGITFLPVRAVFDDVGELSELLNSVIPEAAAAAPA